MNPARTFPAALFADGGITAAATRIPAELPADPLDRVRATLCQAAICIERAGGTFGVLCVLALATATGLGLPETLRALQPHLSPSSPPLFCGQGVVATYNPDDATIVVHRLTRH